MTFNYEEYLKGMEARYGKSWRDRMREYGKVGGKAKVNKGIGGLSPERRAEISKMGVEARRAKNAT